MNYIEVLQSNQVRNVAPYWKRFFSIIIDIAIIYGFYWLIVIGTRNQVSYVRFMTYGFGIMYLYMFYSKMPDSRTIGYMIMKIKSLEIEKIPNKNKIYCWKAIYVATLFVPILSWMSILFYVVTLVVNLMLWNKEEVFRKNKVLIWDYISKTVVVEDK